jgi:hypothetical protein
MEDNIQHYRQPLVTATSILLGFVLNFANNWVPKAFASQQSKETVISVALCLCIFSLIVVLYRILNIDYPRERVRPYYKKTLLVFITGLSVVCLAIIIVMIESYIINNK